MSESGRGGAQSRSTFYSSATGRELHRVEFLPEGEVEPRGGVVLVHGLGDHVSRYGEVAALFTQRGMQVAGFDLPGHGTSPGWRGHIGEWEDVEAIMRETVAFLREELPGDVPLGIVAHSMGAFVALKFLEVAPEIFRFAWLSSPLIRPAAHRGPFVRALARVAGTLLPALTIDSGVREEAVHPVRSEKDHDPLWHHRVSLSWGAAMLRLQDEIAADLPSIDPALALLMTHGSADLICSESDARETFDCLPLRDKRYVLIEEMMHDPFFRTETHRDEVFAAVREWLDGLGFPVRVE